MKAGFSRLACDLPEPTVARIALARPDDGNALDGAACAELVAALEFAAGTPDVRVVVVTHDGAVFGTGDEPPVERDPATGAPVDPLGAALEALARLGKPTVAALDGRIGGPGLALVLACDFVLATARSEIAVDSLFRGGWASRLAPSLVRHVGPKRAAAILVGRTVDADEAARLGLVTARVADGALALETRALSRSLAVASPAALRPGLEALRRG